MCPTELLLPAFFLLSRQFYTSLCVLCATTTTATVVAIGMGSATTLVDYILHIDDQLVHQVLASVITAEEGGFSAHVNLRHRA